MISQELTYISIDLKSFYASAECRERGLNPMTTNLVVADKSRTEKTICLAVTPALKKHGIPGRPRLFQVVQKVKEVNAARLRKTPNGIFTGESCDAKELEENPSLAIAYLVAPPRMGLYMRYSTQIYNIYLRYIAPEDIHVYSIDEVMISAGSYLKTYNMTARELAVKMILEIEKETGIPATAGIGSNLYLSKIAMDIGAKHAEPDEHGVRIAELDEMSYRRMLWSHRPLTDFWRVGRGYAKKLEAHGLYTMGDIARCSIGKPEDYYNEDLLYKLFGINAELLIDHAWGWEPCTLADIKSYRPENNSIGAGQVLQSPYSFEKARLVVREMADLLALDLVDKGLVCDQVVLTVGYDIENLKNPELRRRYSGEITTDNYGRAIPKHAHGSENLGHYTASGKQILQAVTALFERVVDPLLLVRRMNLVANHVIYEVDLPEEKEVEQLDLFTDYSAREEQEKQEEAEQQRERRRQQALLSIKKKFGKNAIMKGMNLEEGATAKERNATIGGHKA